MSSGSDFLPRKESELADWTDNFIRVVEKNAEEWEIPLPEIEEIKASWDKFKVLRTDCTGPHRTQILVAQKNGVKKILNNRIREMVKFRFANPKITNAARVEAGLRPRDMARSTLGAPETRPDYEIKVKDLRRLEINFWDQGSSSRAKPYGAAGAVIFWDLLDTPPSDPSALTTAVLATRTPYTLEFSEEKRGKTVYIAIQWQNSKGQRGPYSEIRQAIIP